MKLKISLRPDGAPHTQFDADMKKADPKGNPWTCQTIFVDLQKTQHARDLALKRWKLRRHRDKWNDFASEVSPILEEGDELTLFAAGKPDA